VRVIAAVDRTDSEFLFARECEVGDYEGAEVKFDLLQAAVPPLGHKKTSASVPRLVG
jgi:hypothetical protein